jgi:hypothetical protein
MLDKQKYSDFLQARGTEQRLYDERLWYFGALNGWVIEWNPRVNAIFDIDEHDINIFMWEMMKGGDDSVGRAFDFMDEYCTFIENEQPEYKHLADVIKSYTAESEKYINPQYTIHDVINEKLTGETQKNVSDFVTFLNENNILLDFNLNESGRHRIWRGAVGGVIGNSIGYMTVNGESDGDGPWTFWLNSSDFDGSESMDDEFKEVIWSFASPCNKCHDNWEQCMGTGKRTILGKEFVNQCHSPLMFINPNENTIKHMKTFLLMSM